MCKQHVGSIDVFYDTSDQNEYNSDQKNLQRFFLKKTIHETEGERRESWLYFVELICILIPLTDLGDVEITPRENEYISDGSAVP